MIYHIQFNIKLSANTVIQDTYTNMNIDIFRRPVKFSSVAIVLTDKAYIKHSISLSHTCFLNIQSILFTVHFEFMFVAERVKYNIFMIIVNISQKGNWPSRIIFLQRRQMIYMQKCQSSSICLSGGNVMQSVVV